MESPMTERHDVEWYGPERPSADFLRAVAELLQTDATDLLSEMGYMPSEAVVAFPAAVAA